MKKPVVNADKKEAASEDASSNNEPAEVDIVSSIIDFIKELNFIVKFKCNITCQSNNVFNYFSITNRFWHVSYVLPQLFLAIACQSNIVFLFIFLFQIVFNMSRVCSTSTILGTNGLNSAEVPLSNKQRKFRVGCFIAEISAYSCNCCPNQRNLGWKRFLIDLKSAVLITRENTTSLNSRLLCIMKMNHLTD